MSHYVVVNVLFNLRSSSVQRRKSEAPHLAKLKNINPSQLVLSSGDELCAIFGFPRYFKQSLKFISYEQEIIRFTTINAFVIIYFSFLGAKGDSRLINGRSDEESTEVALDKNCTLLDKFDESFTKAVIISRIRRQI